MKKYVVCPGYVYSKNDDQRHFINAERLMELYKVSPSECIIDYGNIPYKYPKEMIFLYPDYNGNYTLES